MAKRCKLYFVSDLHGSGKCFRKFLNGGPIYGADVMVLGGDLAGKAIQAITRGPGGRFQFNFRGAAYDLEDGEELRSLEGHEGKVHAVVVAPDAKTAFSGGSDGILRRWALPT